MDSAPGRPNRLSRLQPAVPRSWCWHFITGLTGLVAAAGVALAQPTVRIPDAASCPRCRIALTPIATLHSANDSVQLFHHISIARDSRGRFIVTPTSDVGTLAIYDSSGEFLRLVGARGRGPGEYQLAEVVLVTSGDSLYVFDGLALGLTVLTPEYRYARSLHLGVRAEQALRLGDGQVVIQSRIATPERFGLPVHTLAPDGRVLRSFGSTELTIPPGALLAQYRLIAAASANTVWAARLDRYEVQEWSDAGELRRTLLRDPTWFTRADGEEPGPPDEVRPPSALRGLSPAPDGRLWVLATVARADWRPDPGLAGRDPRRGRPAPAPASLGRYLDTVVELLDPARGQLVAAQRIPGVSLGVAGPGLVYARRERPDGGETIEISRLQLVMPAAARPQ
jgi:6-bladed beta-propeller